MSPQATLQLPKTLDDAVELKGGMDQMTPTLKLHPGACRRSLNFEAAINGGYTRIEGYERYDGRTSPSSVTFKLLPISTFLSVPSVGQTLIGSTSGATAKIIAVSNVTNAKYLAVTQVLGAAFQEGEMTTVSGVVIGAIGPQTITLSKTLKKQYVNLAADVYRALIFAVPGVGPVRGVFGATFNAQFALYAIRDEDPVTLNRSKIWKSTSTGWIQVHGIGALISGFLPLEINFKNGGPVPIKDFTSGPNGTVAVRVVLTGGSWASNTATGKMLFIATASINLSPGEVAVFGATTITMLSAGDQGGSSIGGTNAILPAGGQYEIISDNFYGQEADRRIYGCNGIGRAWEFDGTVLMPIDFGTPAVNATANALHPTHLRVHKLHLFGSVGSSLIHSGPGTPHNFSAGAGAAEYAAGDRITGLEILPGIQSSGALAVFQRNHTRILYGTAAAGPEPFDFVNFQTETGAIPFTNQTLDRVYYLDDRGVIDLKTAQEYGNFTTATLTRYIQKYIDQKHTRANCSSIQRAKGQYRIFFNDGSALYITLDNGKLRGAMPVGLPIPMFTAWSGEDNNGNEVGFLGGTDGFVYQIDKGTSFDGQAIDFEFLLNWNTMRSPRQRKTIHRASVEIADTDYTELKVGARLGSEITAHVQDAATTVPTENELAMQWDHFTWDDFWWDAHADAPLEVDVKGTAERVQYLIGGSSDYLDAFTISSIITHYLPRRSIR